MLFVTTKATAISIDEAAFAPLETALLEALPWEPLAYEPIEESLKAEAIELSRQFLNVAGDGACEIRQVLDAPTDTTH